MPALPASVVVVSRGRAGALTLCLTALVQQDHPDFEIIVVADAPGLRALNSWAEDTGRAGWIKTRAFDAPNISAARNLGIAQAAGEIVAFVDDDAVAEPTWLRRLAEPFETSPAIHAAGGYVRGRNGISYQWTAQSVDRFGTSAPLDVTGDQPVALSPTADRAIKVEGTNMAFRRSVLAEIGGFDPVFRYYLDETDLTLRLAALGGETAIVPLAEVHHGYLANDTRSRARVPTDLTQIAASQAAFVRKHAPEHQRAAALDAFRTAQRKRLIRHLVAGPLDPIRLRALMKGFDAGARDGQTRALAPLPPLPHSEAPFRPIPPFALTAPVVLRGRVWQRRKLQREARKLVAAGTPVSVVCLSPTALYHSVRFTAPGYWMQTGGIFGRSTRRAPLISFTSFKRRIAREIARFAPQRGIDTM